jgi:hypothetical protein
MQPSPEANPLSRLAQLSERERICLALFVTLGSVSWDTGHSYFDLSSFTDREALRGLVQKSLVAIQDDTIAGLTYKGIEAARSLRPTR